MRLKRVIDISMAISEDMAVWPGDWGVTLRREDSIKDGSDVNVTTMSMCVHTGTHVDAPLHFFDGLSDITGMDVDKFMGKTKVFCIDSESCIRSCDLEALPIEAGDILLFKTRNSAIPPKCTFQKDYVYLDASAACFLADKRVKAIGIDYLSVDIYGKEDYPVHKLLLSQGIVIIEGLKLDQVEPGEYFGCFLPLKLAGSDGSPVRAVLLEFES